MPVSSSPASNSCFAKGGENEVKVKLTIGRKAEGSPLERLVEKQRTTWEIVRKNVNEKRETLMCNVNAAHC